MEDYKTSIDKKKFFIDMLNTPEKEVFEISETLRYQANQLEELAEIAKKIGTLRNHTRCEAKSIANDFNIGLQGREDIECELRYLN